MAAGTFRQMTVSDTARQTCRNGRCFRHGYGPTGCYRATARFRPVALVIQPCQGKPMSAKPPEAFGLDRLKTPIGVALLVTDADGALRGLDWEDYELRLRQLLRLQYGTTN